MGSFDLAIVGTLAVSGVFFVLGVIFGVLAVVVHFKNYTGDIRMKLKEELFSIISFLMLASVLLTPMISMLIYSY